MLIIKKRKKVKTKTALSLLLAICLLMTIIPVFSVQASATEGGAETIEINFGESTTEQSGEKYVITSHPGYDIVEEESNQNNDHRNFSYGGGKYALHIYMPKLYWPENTTMENRFTILVNVPVAGYYTMSIQGGKFFAGCFASIYANDTYMGDYNFYDPASTRFIGETRTLNSVYLTEGYNKISFRSRFGNDSFVTPGLLLHKVWFEPVGMQAELTEVTANIPSVMEKGNTIDVTAQALMSDGSPYHFGLKEDGTEDTETTINITSSNTDVVAVSNVAQEIGETHETTATLSAIRGGTATITVSATVNGVTESTTQILTVEGPVELGKVSLVLDKNPIIAGENVSSLVSGTMTDESPAVLDGAEISYESLSPAIATVGNTSGIVTGISAGTATIKVEVTLGGATISDTATVTVTSAGEAITTGQIRVGADGINDVSGAVTVSGIGYGTGGFGGFESFAVGSQVTLVADETAEGKDFLYWKNSAANRIISNEQQFTFKIGTATNITAIYRNTNKGEYIGAGDYLVEFIDRNGKVLKSEYLNNGETIAPPLDDPFSVGYIFDKWSPDVPDTAMADGIYVAQYNNDTTPYTVTITNPNGTILPAGGEYTYNTKVTVSPGSFAEGEKFAYWEKEGVIVSYDEEYSFYVWDDTEVTAVGISTTDNAIPVPAIYMDKLKTEVLEVGDPEIPRLMFLCERTLPEGYELVEAGILVSATNNEPTLAKDGFDSKAVSQSTDKNGQFTMRLEGIPQSNMGYARAYMIYKTSTNGCKTIYSNVVSELGI